MTVRAKFKVDSIEIQQHTRPVADAEGNRNDWKNTEKVEMRSVKMSPVFGNGDPNHENTKFWTASPSGSLVLGTINPEAWAAFEIGKEYYVDFTPAE